MMAIPSIDMEATGRNITRLRQQAGLTVRDLQEIFGFTTRRQSTTGSTAPPCRQSTT